MKKTLIMLMVLCMVATMFACASSTTQDTATEAADTQETVTTEATEAPAAEAETPVFYFCISHMSNAWAVTAATSMQEAAAAVGADLTVLEAGQDINQQVSQIELAVANEADAIIIEPVSAEGVLAAVSEAEAAGIPCIIFNQNISDPSAATCFVGVSNADLGYMEMERALSDIGGTGNIAILLGPRGSEGQLGRSEGYSKALAEYPDVTVVFEEEAAWTTEDALKLAENWLSTGTEINAFVSQNDNMALGAVKAIEDAGLSGQIKVYGLDAVDDALKAVQDGRLEITVDQATTSQSAAAIDVAMKLFAGETVDSEVLVQGFIIDASNVADYIK